MSDGMKIAAMSMLNDMQKLTSISENIANAVTPGYKRTGTQTLFSSMIPALPSASTASLAPILQTYTDMRPGALRYTASALDVAIESSGFFELNSAGQIYYTRQGNFTLDTQGRLVTQKGEIVNGVSGEIRLTSDTPSIDRQGRVFENEKQIGQLKVVEFSHPEALVRASEGKYQVDNALETTQIIPANDKSIVRQKYLEASNVNATTEMVKMIEVMRHFESGQKVIQMYDEMMDKAITKLGEF